MIIDMFDDYLNSSHLRDKILVRPLQRNDLPKIRRLCQEWFPVHYPDQWYEQLIDDNGHRELSSDDQHSNHHYGNNNYINIVATINNEIIGLLISEIRSYDKLNYEDYGFLTSNNNSHSNQRSLSSKSPIKCQSDDKVVYILTIGVIQQLRRNGIATLLLCKLLEKISTLTLVVRAIYLHVLITNQYAICFYEKLKFKRYKLLSSYYLINQQTFDGYLYVYYLNNGHDKQVDMSSNNDRPNCCHHSLLRLWSSMELLTNYRRRRQKLQQQSADSSLLLRNRNLNLFKFSHQFINLIRFTFKYLYQRICKLFNYCYYLTNDNHDHGHNNNDDHNQNIIKQSFVINNNNNKNYHYIC